MRFFAIRNIDTGILAAIIVQSDSAEKIYVMAYNKTYEEVLLSGFAAEKFFVEKRVNGRTIVREEVPRSDPRYFEVLKQRVTAPYVVHLGGTIQARTPEEAVRKLWTMFSPKEEREIASV